MRVLLLSLSAIVSAAAFAQQTLVCPPAAAGRPCDVFHYHVQMYSPDKRTFTEIIGANQFATQQACDRAREQEMAANARVAAYFRDVREQQYQPDRFGPCHCDLTDDRSTVVHLDGPRRALQLRTAEEIRLRVREHLLDNKVTHDSELLRELYADAPRTAMLGAPKFVPLPAAATAPPQTSPDDLASTRTIDASKPPPVATNLPLAEIGVVSPQVIADPPVVEEVVVAEPVIDPPTDAEIVSAQEAAERFIGFETQRIDAILRASSAVADEQVKAKIFDACMQRIQLLSNLRLLIEGSGIRSTLAAAARDAKSEEARLALVARLFGDDIRAHWAPADATDVIVMVDDGVAAAPERILRDTSGRVSTDEKKRALYVLLAQTQPTEDQRLWLSTVVEGFLR